jgi:prepilin-type N-terminal cleavage/methylation domain-containing protein
MKKIKNKKNKKGFSLIELVLASAIFSVFSLGITVAVLQGSAAERSSVQSEMARQWAMEGIEGARAIQAESFDNLSNVATSGVRLENGKWELFGEKDEWEGYTRVISISSAERDGDDNIVSEGGDEDSDLKLVRSIVTKDDFALEYSVYLSRREIIIP